MVLTTYCKIKNGSGKGAAADQSPTQMGKLEKKLTRYFEDPKRVEKAKKYLPFVRIIDGES